MYTENALCFKSSAHLFGDLEAHGAGKCVDFDPTERACDLTRKVTVFTREKLMHPEGWGQTSPCSQLMWDGRLPVVQSKQSQIFHLQVIPDPRTNLKYPHAVAKCDSGKGLLD